MMAKLIYSAIASADGYIEDPGGSIDWGMPDEELLGFIDVPTGLARGSGLGNSHRSSAEARATGRSDRRLTPASRKGPGSA
jgi:hypothetical protein